MVVSKHGIIKVNKQIGDSSKTLIVAIEEPPCKIKLN